MWVLSHSTWIRIYSGLVCVLTDVTWTEKIDRERRNFVSKSFPTITDPTNRVLKSYTEALVDGVWENKEIAARILKRYRNWKQTVWCVWLRTYWTYRVWTKTVSSSIRRNSWIWTSWWNILPTVSIWCFQVTNIVKKNYRILTDITQRDLWVEIDQDKMTQVLDNIINNAIKYSPDGGRIIIRLDGNSYGLNRECKWRRVGNSS